MALAFLQKRETANPWPLNVVEQSHFCVRSDEEMKTSIRSSPSLPIIMTKPLIPTAKHFVALKISAVPEVENVFTMVDDAGKTMYVYTVVDDFAAAVRLKVYEKEQEIIDEFEMFDFDFHIISRMGAPLSECVSEPSIELTYQR